MFEGLTALQCKQWRILAFVSMFLVVVNGNVLVRDNDC